MRLEAAACSSRLGIFRLQPGTDSLSWLDGGMTFPVIPVRPNSATQSIVSKPQELGLQLCTSNWGSIHESYASREYSTKSIESVQATGCTCLSRTSILLRKSGCESRCLGTVGRSQCRDDTQHSRLFSIRAFQRDRSRKDKTQADTSSLCNEAIAETACSRNVRALTGFKIRIASIVYHLADEQSRFGVFKDYFGGLCSRQKDIADACKANSKNIVRIMDNQKCYPSIRLELATKSWLAACDTTSLDTAHRELGLKCFKITGERIRRG